MNTLSRTSVLAMAALAMPFLCPQAHAADTYIGLSRTTHGESYASFPTAKNVENYNNPLAFKLFGGINLTDRYGIEIGYGAFGSLKVADPAPGGTNRFRFSPRLFYVAGKASLPLGESFELFGKFGLALNRITTQSNQEPANTETAVRPMLGFGVGYKFTSHISAVLEYNHYGTVRGGKQQKLELGVKYAF